MEPPGKAIFLIGERQREEKREKTNPAKPSINPLCLINVEKNQKTGFIKK